MGSQSDWQIMRHASKILDELDVLHQCLIISAHRTPERLSHFAKNAEKNGFQIIIAGAGGAAHLPGMVAAWTHLPVLGVPVNSQHLKGLDSLLSIVQMPGGIPVGSFAIGKSGSINAALMSANILALNDKKLRARLLKWRQKQTQQVDLYPSDDLK
ncbi:MAG: 5-(carboxyamino)imidazole ribonucleotide mutase [Pseudomonadota bacterium]